MNIAETIKDTRAMAEDWKRQRYSIGFVPTMGFLHAGHISLIEKARKENDRVVVSIFVNPIQFGPNEDFSKYPRDMNRDLKMCKQTGVDLVFVPQVQEMYPIINLAYVDIEALGENLCGAKRPNHFRGVCTVVTKLFHIITPDRAYFGEKDAQQLAIIQRMTQDLSFPIEIVPCPIVREPDGLAMSSRNSYLSSEERSAALVIPRSLAKARRMLLQGEKDAEVIRHIIEEEISREPLARIDYVDVVDACTLNWIDKIQGPVLTAVAVYIGKTRLIDNFSFKEECTCCSQC